MISEHTHSEAGGEDADNFFFFTNVHNQLHFWIFMLTTQESKRSILLCCCYRRCAGGPADCWVPKEVNLGGLESPSAWVAGRIKMSAGVSLSIVTMYDPEDCDATVITYVNVILQGEDK